MGGSTKKETSSQNTTQQVQLPAWLTNAGQEVYQGAKQFSDANPVQAYTGQISPGLSANQQQASQTAQSSQGTGQHNLAIAQGLTSAAAGGTVAPIDAGTFDKAQADKYTNPYVQNVQQRTLDEMRRQNLISDQSLGDSVAGAGAYGGTRQSVLTAEKAKGDSLNMLDYLAQSNADAYGNAQSQFNTDRSARVGAETTNNANQQSILDRLLAAGGQSAQIGVDKSNLASTDISNLARTGAVEQATQGDQLSSAYQEFLRNQNAPLDRYSQLMALLSGTPHDTTSTGTATGTSTTKTSGGLLNALLGAGQIGASIFASDRRLKTDIERIGEFSDGLGRYRYRYAWGGPMQEGVMADEVAELRPWALGPVIGGFSTVDYSMLDEAMLEAA